jgi:hypothetical protein
VFNNSDIDPDGTQRVFRPWCPITVYPERHRGRDRLGLMSKLAVCHVT